MVAGRRISLDAGLADVGPIGTQYTEVSSSRLSIAHTKGSCKCEGMIMWLVLDKRGLGVEFANCVLHGQPAQLTPDAASRPDRAAVLEGFFRKIMN